MYYIHYIQYIYSIDYIILIKWYPSLPRYGRTFSGPCGQPCRLPAAMEEAPEQRAPKRQQKVRKARCGQLCERRKRSRVDLGWWWLHCACIDMCNLMCLCVQTECFLVLMMQSLHCKTKVSSAYVPEATVQSLLSAQAAGIVCDSLKHHVVRTAMLS